MMEYIAKVGDLVRENSKKCREINRITCIP